MKREHRRFVVQVRTLKNSAWRSCESFRRLSPALEEADTWFDAGAYDARVIDTRKFPIGDE